MFLCTRRLGVVLEGHLLSPLNKFRFVDPHGADQSLIGKYLYVHAAPWSNTGICSMVLGRAVGSALCFVCSSARPKIQNTRLLDFCALRFAALRFDQGARTSLRHRTALLNSAFSRTEQLAYAPDSFPRRSEDLHSLLLHHPLYMRPHLWHIDLTPAS